MIYINPKIEGDRQFILEAELITNLEYLNNNMILCFVTSILLPFCSFPQGSHVLLCLRFNIVFHFKELSIIPDSQGPLLHQHDIPTLLFSNGFLFSYEEHTSGQNKYLFSFPVVLFSYKINSLSFCRFVIQILPC